MGIAPVTLEQVQALLLASLGGGVTPSPTGTAAIGDSPAASRANHVHAHGQANTGDLHTQYQLRSEKGAALGYPALDGGGKVPLAQLPDTVIGAVDYQGTWNANTNTPNLGGLTPSKGDYYVVSVAGATNLGGITDWVAGDWAIYNGSIWQKVDNTDAVSSVNGLVGAVTGLEVLAAKGAANGYASLDAGGLVQQLPAGGKVLTGATGGFRKVGSGVTNVAGAATATLGTFTRNAGEQLIPAVWVQQNVAGLGFAEDRAAIGAEGVSVFMERTANANEFTLRAINNNVTTARDVEWAVYGIVA